MAGKPARGPGRGGVPPGAGSAGMSTWLGLALLILILDQFTKVMVTGYFQLGDSRTVTSFFNLVRVHNEGAAFSFLAGASGWQRWLFTGIGLVAVVLILWMLRSHAAQRLFALALSLILGGAIGNLVDRIIYGHVVDFLQFHYGGWYFPSFNIADSAITIGACALILDELLRVRRSR
ncbi:MAG: lipoprotein signal peptidase [Rhodoferax sp.]|jgi:signal peptidase II|nr:lipoprotein signal peptidase [Rhodoferax sp.]